MVIFASLELTKNPNANKFGPLNYPSGQQIGAEKIPNAKITFSFSKEIKIPNSINVYQIVAGDRDNNRLLFDRVAKKLGATASAEIKTFGTEKAYVISQNNFYFTGNLNTGYFSFTGKSSRIVDTADKDSIKLSTWDFLFLLGLTKTLANQPIVSYYSSFGQELAVSQNISLSDIIGLSYRPEINSFPVIGLGSTASPLAVLIDKKTGAVIRLDFSVPTIDTKVTGSYEVFSLNEVLKTSINNLGVISFADKTGGQIANYNLNDLASVNFTKIYLAYYVTPQAQGFLQPVFVLEGTAIFPDKRSGRITAILPAVKNVK